MAKREESVIFRKYGLSNDEHWNMFCDRNILDKIRALPGVASMEGHNPPWALHIDPRYDWSGVLEDIRKLADGEPETFVLSDRDFFSGHLGNVRYHLDAAAASMAAMVDRLKTGGKKNSPPVTQSGPKT